MAFPNREAVASQILALDLDALDQVALNIGAFLERFIRMGSQTHILARSQLRVYHNVTGNYPGKEVTKIMRMPVGSTDPDGVEVPTTISGLMANGTKFLDAIIWLALSDRMKPMPARPTITRRGDAEAVSAVYNDHARIAKYIFVVYFFIMIRGAPPHTAHGSQGDVVPKFISSVMSVAEKMNEVTSYLASFKLDDLDPTWVRNVAVKGLGQEAQSRLGLGVAGYRICSVFNLVVPDKRAVLLKARAKNSGGGTEVDIDEVAPDRADAVFVAQSFMAAGPCWDFHPATRSANIISKYGNINKNCANLILDVYTEETIARLVKSKKLFEKPVFDESHTQYRTWSRDMAYKATRPIFRAS
jgi:hypothetical protein